MISRNRSVSTAAAMSIERTTSANSTVTCLYSAVSPETPVGAPHSPQNLAFSRKPVPHDPHATPAVIRTPPISGSTTPIAPRIGRPPAKNGVIALGVKRFPVERLFCGAIGNRRWRHACTDAAELRSRHDQCHHRPSFQPRTTRTACRLGRYPRELKVATQEYRAQTERDCSSALLRSSHRTRATIRIAELDTGCGRPSFRHDIDGGTDDE